MKLKHTLCIAFAAVLGAAAPLAVQAQGKPVVLRFAADFSPPPHPAGMSMKHFQDRHGLEPEPLEHAA